MSNFNCDFWIKDGDSSTYDIKEELKSLNQRRIAQIKWSPAHKSWVLLNTNRDNWDYKYVKMLGLILEPIVGTESKKVMKNYENGKITQVDWEDKF